MRPRPSLPLAQVIDQFALSRATARRGIDNGRFPGAYKDSNGRWMIPVDDLIATGIKARQTWLETEGAHQGAHPAQNELAQGAHNPADPIQTLLATERAHPEDERAHERAHHATQLELLQTQLDTEKRLREAAERNANDLRSAMRMIEASQPQQAPRDQAATPSRRRWWQRP